MGGILALNCEILVITVIIFGAALLVRRLLYCFIALHFGAAFVLSFDQYEVKKYHPLGEWFVTGCIFFPFIEEVIYRLPLFIFIGEDLDILACAVLASAFIFSVSHLPEHGKKGIAGQYLSYLLVWLFLLSLLLGSSFIWTGSIFPAMMIHAGVNAGVLWKIMRRRQTNIS